MGGVTGQLILRPGLHVQRLTRCPCPSTEPPTGVASPMRSNGLDQAMRSGWIFGIGLVVLSAIASAPARAEGPGPDFKRLEDKGDTFKSPDNTLLIEQYSKDLGGFEGFTYQFWLFDKDHKNPFLLNHDE